jgi:hypothetical protein
VLREQGTAIPAFDASYKIKTRRLFLAGIGNEFRLDKIFTYVASASDTQLLTLTPYYIQTNASGGAVSGTYQARGITSEKLFVLDYSQSVEGLDLEIAQSTLTPNHIGIQNVLICFTGQGIEDSGKA